MLFGQTYKQVLTGTKTEIRIPIKQDEVLAQDPTRVVTGSRTKWIVGNTYAVQPAHGQKAAGRILLLKIEEGVLRDMGQQDIQAEGFASLEEFIADWESTHGHYDPDQPVWIFHFEREPTPEEKAARKRKEQEELLWRIAKDEFDKLSAVGHELGEWQVDGDLQLKNMCTRCQGEVTVSVGKMNMVGYIPLMRGDACFADYPEQMAAAKEEWERRLAAVYRRLLVLGRQRTLREAGSRTNERN